MDESDLLFNVSFFGTVSSAVNLLSTLVAVGIEFGHFNYYPGTSALTIKFTCLADKLRIESGDVLYGFKDGGLRIDRKLPVLLEEEE